MTTTSAAPLTRWVRAGIYGRPAIHAPEQQCWRCGSFWGMSNGRGFTNQPHDCGVTECRACRRLQCMSNGLGDGQCSLCFVGLLEGWNSEKTCSRSKCTGRAVAVERKRLVCRDCLKADVAKTPDPRYWKEEAIL